MDLRASSLGFYRVWHAALGGRHGLFSRAWRTPSQLARGLDAEAVATWCRGAEALGLLERRGARYRLRAEHAATLGDKQALAYLGHHFEYLAAKSLAFGALDDALRGKRVRVDASAAYPVATRWDHLAFFEAVLPRERALGRRLRAGADVLDLGCGDGAWSAMLKERYPAARVVATDVDRRALAKARRREGVRVRARPAPEAFDLVFLGEVLAAAPDPVAPLAAAFRALRPGGRLVALEGLRPPDDRAPRGWGERLVLAMQLDFSLDGSRYLSADEALAAARQAGFARAKARDLGGSLFAITATKPMAPNARRRVRTR